MQNVYNILATNLNDLLIILML